MENDERRKFPRLPCSLPLEYLPAGEGKTVPYSTNSKNLSLGGVCFIVFEPLKRGDILNLTFSIPGTAESVNAQGKVCWCSYLHVKGEESKAAYEAGIEFISIAETDKSKLQQLVAHYQTS